MVCPLVFPCVLLTCLKSNKVKRRFSIIVALVYFSLKTRLRSSVKIVCCKFFSRAAHFLHLQDKLAFPVVVVKSIVSRGVVQNALV